MGDGDVHVFRQAAGSRGRCQAGGAGPAQHVAGVSSLGAAPVLPSVIGAALLIAVSSNSCDHRYVRSSVDLRDVAACTRRPQRQTMESCADGHLAGLNIAYGAEFYNDMLAHAHANR
jgi:hypothetical protein